MKRTLALVLALVMCSFALISCKKEEEAVEDTAPVSTETDNGLEYDENGYLKDKVGNRDFGGTEINICGWSNVEKHVPEFGVKELTGADVVSSAAYIKNKKVEDRLRVKLAFETVDGWTGSGKTGAGQAQLTRVETTAGTDEIDLIGTYSWNAGVFTTNGYLTNLNTMPHVDLTAPWWNSTVQEKSSIYGKVYFATGDIAPSLIRSTYAVFFNKSLVEDYNGLEDPYALYESGDWTLDKMIEMSSKAYSDAGEAGVKEKTDKFGFVTFGTATDAFYHGSDLMLIENASDGSMLLSDDFTSSKVHDLLVKLINFDKTAACFITAKTQDSPDDGWHRSIWESGNALFMLEEFSQVENWVDSNAKNFGILPMPKYDKEQTKYYTLSGFYHTIYCVPKALTGNEAVGATLECLASECYRRVTPAYYENLIQTRYSTTVKEAMMFDAVRECVVFDSGRIYNQHFGWKTAQQFRINLRESDTNWASASDGLKGNIEANVTSLNQLASAVLG